MQSALRKVLSSDTQDPCPLPCESAADAVECLSFVLRGLGGDPEHPPDPGLSERMQRMQHAMLGAIEFLRNLP